MKTTAQASGFDIDMAWRYPTDAGVTWRLATLSDMPRLRQLWNEMDERLGEKQDRPDLFAMPVLITFVAEDAEGTLVGGLYGETVVDWTMIGTSRQVARAVDPLFPTLHFFLFDRHIRIARMVVPMALRKHMHRLIPKMRDLTELLAHFAYTVRL